MDGDKIAVYLCSSPVKNHILDMQTPQNPKEPFFFYKGVRLNALWQVAV